MVQETLQRRLEPWRWGTQWPVIRSWQRPIERIIRADLTTTWEVAKKLTVNHSIVIQHSKQIGKLKKCYKRVPHEVTTIQRNCHFEASCSLMVRNSNVPFLDWIVTSHEKWILSTNQQLTAQLLGWEEAPKLFPKPNLHSKRSWSLFNGLLPIWSTIASWTLANHYIWEVCSANWWKTPKTVMTAGGIHQLKGPNCTPPQWPTACHTTNASKVERIGLGSFASFAIFTWALTNQLLLLQAYSQIFAGKTLPQPAGGRKCFLKVGWILKPRFLYYRISKLISLWQKCVDW